MSSKPPGTLSLVLVPAIITLIVTVLRFVGEKNGWSPLWFGTGGAGGDGALLGISWLIILFGLWFGIRLKRAGSGGPPGKILLKAVIAVAAAFGAVAILMGMDLLWIPSPEEPGEPRGIVYFMASLGLGTLLAFVAWGRVALTMLVYGLLARIPVVILTWLAVENDWGTHYTAVPKEFVLPPGTDTFTFLATPQMTFWLMVTVLLGTLAASVGALIAGKPKSKS